MGDLGDVIKADPEAYGSLAVSATDEETAAESEAEAAAEDAEEERRSLKRQLSKKDALVKQVSTGKPVQSIFPALRPDSS